jgi:S-formylglutathione hydrolase FrmB
MCPAPDLHQKPIIDTIKPKHTRMRISRLLMVLVAALSYVSNGAAQRGTVDCSQVIRSEILKKDMHYSVYLPEGYGSSSRTYPVLYLLHGMMDNYTGWVSQGEVNRIASEAIAGGAAPEMIIVMPDGLIDAFYINNYDKSVRWEDFFYSEFIPQVEKKYRIAANRNSRAIAGLSMGGYGSLYHAIRHKDMFKACYAMSAAVIEVEPLQEGEQPNDFSRNFNLKTWGPNNAEGLPENYKAHSVQEIVKAMEEYKPPTGFVFGGAPAFPEICIDCGDDDFLLKQNTNLVHIMKSKNIPFEFRVRDGGHTWDYWRTALDLALRFVGDSFRE